jgi:thiamine biosynthesis protein ThiS
MRLIVNGEPYEHAGEATVSGLLRALEANEEHVATMLNDEIVTKPQRPETRLRAEDRVEILVFAGGG